MTKDKFRCRPFAYPVNVIKKSKDGFKPAPFTFKKPTIGRFMLTIPFDNGKFAYLEIPNNYCEYDIEIIFAQLKVVAMTLEGRKGINTCKKIL